MDLVERKQALVRVGSHISDNSVDTLAGRIKLALSDEYVQLGETIFHAKGRASLR